MCKCSDPTTLSARIVQMEQWKNKQTANTEINLIEIGAHGRSLLAYMFMFMFWFSICDNGFASDFLWRRLALNVQFRIVNGNASQH